MLSCNINVLGQLPHIHYIFQPQFDSPSALHAVPLECKSAFLYI